MQSRSTSILIDTYVRLTGEVIAQLAQALPERSFLLDDHTPKPLREAERAWRPVPKTLDEIRDTLTAFGNEVFKVSTNTDYNSVAQSRIVTEIATRYRSKIDTLSATALADAAKCLDILRTVALPPRPSPQDAVQEARLAGLKSDLRMVLDPIGDPDALIDELKRLLARAFAEKDDLTIWLLASSTWSDDYLRSRGEDFAIRQIAWVEGAADVLDTGVDGKLAEYRRAYQMAAHPTRGIPLLHAVFVNTLASVVNEIGRPPVPGLL